MVGSFIVLGLLVVATLLTTFLFDAPIRLSGLMFVFAMMIFIGSPFWLAILVSTDEK